MMCPRDMAIYNLSWNNEASFKIVLEHCEIGMSV